jgi:hypothetical protein
MRCLIVGAAKSGTTALVYSVAKALGQAQIYFEEPISTLDRLPANVAVKLLLEDESNCDISALGAGFDRKILLVRDPRDNLVSRLLYFVAGSRQLLGSDARLDRFLYLLYTKQRDPDAVTVLDLLAAMHETARTVLDQSVETGMRLADFIDANRDAWFIMSYEALVAGDLAGLSAYLGVTVRGHVSVDPTYARVERTRGRGDWRNWLTASDVADIRPILAPVMRRLGYEDDWERAPVPLIAPKHSWEYVLRLVAERRRHYGLPPFEWQAAGPRGGAAAQAPCNICGAAAFGPGPGGRGSVRGLQPACRGCGALERQRVLRALVRSLPIGFLAARRALLFGSAAGLAPSWFRSWELVSMRGRTELPSSARPDGSVDLIVLDHVLEYVEDDRRAFAALTRLLSSDGVMFGCFAAPQARPVSLHLGAPEGGVWHRYGADLARRFDCARAGLAVLAVEASDPSTGARVQVHVFCRHPTQVAAVTRWTRDWDWTIAVRPADQ